VTSGSRDAPEKRRHGSLDFHCRAESPYARERGWGRVINISTKLARTGVTANTVSPGCAHTEGFENRTLTQMAERFE
jgi:hypothetical protein